MCLPFYSTIQDAKPFHSNVISAAAIHSVTVSVPFRLENAGLFHQNWNPRSGSDLLAVLQTQQGANARVLRRCVGELLWSLRTIRNKMTIE